MAERLAALGLRPPVKAGETPQQKQERERREREEKLRKAEEEDARREEERQKRLAEESIAPPTAGKIPSKKPPPPPSRKNKVETPQQDTRQAEADVRRLEAEAAEKVIREQQDAQEAETRRMEYVTMSAKVVQMLIQHLGKRNDARKKNLTESVKLPKPVFKLWKSKLDRAR